jgi:hypothetical protein
VLGGVVLGGVDVRACMEAMFKSWPVVVGGMTWKDLINGKDLNDARLKLIYRTGVEVVCCLILLMLCALKLTPKTDTFSGSGEDRWTNFLASHL